MTEQTYKSERHMEALQKRRMAREHRNLCRIEKREAEAEKQIGIMNRGGDDVYYVWPQGGNYREGRKLDLIAFLIRNNYA